MAPISRTTLPFLSLLFGLNPLRVQGAEPLFFEISRAWRQTSYTGPADVHPDHRVDALDLLGSIERFHAAAEPSATTTPTASTTPIPTETPSATPSLTPTTPAVAWRPLHTDPNEASYPNIRQIYGRLNGECLEIRVTWYNFDEDFARSQRIGFSMYMNTDCDRTSGCDEAVLRPGSGLECELSWGYEAWENPPQENTGHAGLYPLETWWNPDLQRFDCMATDPTEISITRSSPDTFDFCLPLAVLQWSTCIEMQVKIDADPDGGGESGIVDHVPDNLAANRVRFP